MPTASFVYFVGSDIATRDVLQVEIERCRPWTLRCFPDERDWLDAAPGLVPGCVLLDLPRPSESLAVLERMNAREAPHVAVLLSKPCDTASTVSAIKAGATDVVELPTRWECLAGSIEAALRELPERRQRQLRREQAQALIDRLSPREHDVMLAMIEGLSNKLIAYRLQLSPRTVEVHRASLLAKLGISNAVELLKCAMDAGLPSQTRLH